MNPKKLKIQKLEKDKYRIYQKKALDFYTAMQAALVAGNWNSVGLEAVHCSISVTDAILCYSAGVRALTSNHQEAADVLLQHITTRGVKESAKRLRSIIARKNLIEYEARSFTKKEALAIAKDVERYFDWAKSMLP